MQEKYLTAIAHIPANDSQKEKFVKYRKINANKIDRFMKFFKGKFPRFHHVNFYWKDSKQFYIQIKNEFSF